MEEKRVKHTDDSRQKTKREVPSMGEEKRIIGKKGGPNVEQKNCERGGGTRTQSLYYEKQRHKHPEGQQMFYMTNA